MGQAIVTLPDGRKARVTFDSQEQLDAVVNDLVGQSKPPEPQRTTGEELARQGGLTARYGIEGAAALPGMIANVPALGLNKLIDAAEAISGKKIDFRFPDQNAALSDALTQAGLPQPETKTERLVGDVSRAVAGAGTGAGIANQVAKTATGATQQVAQKVAAAPGMQGVSAASGATAGGVVREEGGGPWAQFFANVAGGMAPFTLWEGGKALARGGRALLEPLHEKGREQIVGRTLNEAATNAQRARTNMANAKEIVPGSEPTAADVSQDYGIISTQRAVKATNPAPFAERASDQNAARQQYLGVAAKDQKHLDAAITRRDNVTRPLREQAFSAAKGKHVNTTDIESKIDGLLSSPDNAGSRTQQALAWAKEQIAGKTDPRALYAVRKEISDVIAGKVDSEKSFLRYTAGELKQVRSFIDDEIEKIAPTWKQYLTKYRQLSRPIERMGALQESQGKAALAAPDVRTGYDFLSQAKWKTQVNNLLADGKLTKGQQQRVKNIADDLARGASINDSAIRAIGSNTTQDMTAANVLGQMLGSTKMTPLARSVMRPLQWLYKIPEQELKDLLTGAMLDPKIGAELMKNASGAQLGKVSALLRQRFVASGLGTGAAGTNQRPSQSESNQVPGQ